MTSTSTRGDQPQAAPTPTPGHHIVLAGATINHDNRGVEALGSSVADHLAASPAVGALSVLDNGWGVREHSAGVELVGVRSSRRWHRRESWARVRFDQAVGGLGNPVVERLRGAHAVLDISGGDSFTDLYGPRRLTTVSAPKEAALRARRPLVLLPQTFGPFVTPEGRHRAERLVREATLAYSRDAWSHEQLLTLAGADADTSRLREGVDVAFGLREREPDAATVARFVALAQETVAGVNISGLLRDDAAARQFGLVGDYVTTMTGVVRSLIATGAFVALVPHVHGVRDGENDATVIGQVLDRLSPAERERTWMLPPWLRATELKWCIARMDWFAGSRMHSTIAALGSAVPAFGYAYSDKTHGVFATCGVGGHVTDARRLAGQDAVEQAMHSFSRRDSARRTLQARVPDVVTRARSQLEDVLAAITSWRAGGAPGGIA